MSYHLVIKPLVLQSNARSSWADKINKTFPVGSVMELQRTASNRNVYRIITTTDCRSFVLTNEWVEEFTKCLEQESPDAD